MANTIVKISDLGNLSSFTGNTLFPVVDTSNAYITVKSSGYTLLNYISGNITTLRVAGNVTTSSGYFVGNGYFLTSVTSSYGNANVASYLPTHAGNVNATNLNAGVVLTDNYKFANGTVIPPSSINNGFYQGFEVGWLDIPQETYSANVVLGTGDRGQHWYSNTASQTNVFIPNSAAVSWNIGSTITIVNNGTGYANIIANAGVTLRLAGSATTGGNYRYVTSYGVGTLLNVNANLWIIYGTSIV
jgi:hypothetical protein